MIETIIQVRGLLSAGCTLNVEKALTKLRGVHHASANYLNSTATVHYDETQITLMQLQAAVADCGYVCAGESRPEHTGHSGHTLDHVMLATPTHADHSAHMEDAEPRQQWNTLATWQLGLWRITPRTAAQPE